MQKIKITSAVVVGGEIVKPGEVVAVDADIANNLVYRGAAELVDDDDNAEDEQAADAPDADEGKTKK